MMGDIIECPKHNGRFNYKTGPPKTLPSASTSRSMALKSKATKFTFKSRDCGAVPWCLPRGSALREGNGLGFV